MTNKPTSNIIVLDDGKSKKKEYFMSSSRTGSTFFYEKESSKETGKCLYNDLLLNCYSLTSIVIFKTNRTVLKNRELSKIINDNE